MKKDRSVWEPQNFHFSRQNIRSSFKLLYICQDESPVLLEISHDRLPLYVLISVLNSAGIRKFYCNISKSS